MEDTLEIKRPKLLVADDSVTVRKVIELTFAEEGVDVFAVGDGEAAMKKFVEVEPDIVLADVNMPDPTGYHICEMIKQDETTKDIPVLLLVGSFEPFDQTEAERVKADGFLTKPFQSVRELVGRVSELLDDGNGIPVEPVDMADIQGLYESSFAESYRTENEVRSNTFLGDAGMDDDLIETVSREGGPEPEPVVIVDDVRDTEMQGYDWMAQPTVDVDEPVSTNGDGAVDLPKFERIVDDFDDTLEVEEPEPESPEKRVADPVPEVHSYESHEVDAPVATPPEETDVYRGRGHERAAAPLETQAHEPSLVEEPTTVESPLQLDQPKEVERPTELQEVVAAPAAAPHSGEVFEAAAPGASTAHVEAREPSDFEGLTAPPVAAEAPKSDDQAQQFSTEPSEEFINALAARVIEKLSDRAVRDIAREAVPRIAEKLIREALDPESNKRSNS